MTKLKERRKKGRKDKEGVGEGGRQGTTGKERREGRRKERKVSK